jgi:hypothetical protein
MPQRSRAGAERQVTLRLRYRPSLDELIGSVAAPLDDRTTIWEEPAMDGAVLRWSTDEAAGVDTLIGFTVPAAIVRRPNFWMEYELGELGSRVGHIIHHEADSSLDSLSDPRRHLRSSDSQLQIEEHHLVRASRLPGGGSDASEESGDDAAFMSEPESWAESEPSPEAVEQLAAAMAAAGRAIELLDSDDPEATSRLVHLAAEVQRVAAVISRDGRPAPSLAYRAGRLIGGGMSLTPREAEYLRRGLILSGAPHSWDESIKSFHRFTRSIGGQFDV